MPTISEAIMTRTLITTVLMLTITGCSTTPISSLDADPVPPERIYAHNQPLQEEHGTLTLTRDSGLLGSACGIIVKINGVLTAKLDPAETVSLDLTPGTYIVSASADQGLCETGVKEVKDTITPNTTIRYRMGYDPSGTLGLFPTMY
jgi:hypothetical protein|tara:strand:- start:83 stop:523 length:441 start_codon:yes stop_codon:yes gene_type:complete